MNRYDALVDLGDRHEAAGVSRHPWWCGGLAGCVQSAVGRARAQRWPAQHLGPDDPEAQARRAVFEQTLQQLGWTVGRDLKIETRQVGGDLDSLRRYAAELVALAPDVIFSIGSVMVAPLQQATRTIPIVFVAVPDPVGNIY